MAGERPLHELFARELDRLPLPAPDLWVPAARAPRPPRAVMMLGALVAAVVLGIAGGLALREARSITPPAAATPVPSVGAVQGGATQISLNSDLNYYIVLPAQWRRSEAERIVPSDKGLLLDRKVFTARTQGEEAHFVGSQFLPWDLFVEIWDRGGQSAEDWAHDRFACADGCTAIVTRINGTTAWVIIVGPPLAGRVYVIERGDRLLVLRYGIGDESNRPADVTEETLQQIINSLRPQ